MDIFTILFLIGAALIAPIMISIVVRNQQIGSPTLAGAVAVGFGAFTVITIASEGVEQVILNHTDNYWGTQVWYDLIIAASVALFFIAPRARAVGMSVPLWGLLAACTASIGRAATGTTCAAVSGAWCNTARSRPLGCPYSRKLPFARPA